MDKRDNITRKQALEQMGGFALGSMLLPSVAASSKKSSQKPNILWIVSEDNSASYMGCYGNERATTPNIDQLASEGILYENVFAPCPVCAPTRSSLITGVYANSMGTQHMRSTYPIPEFIHFYPYYLRKAGYYCMNSAPRWDGKKDYNTPDRHIWNDSTVKATYKNRAPNQPFFSIINLHTSHESQIHQWIPDNQLKHHPRDMQVPAYLPDTDEVRHDLAQYYDKVEKMDRQVGGILDRLEKDGLTDNTIVFYYSDHGGVLPRSKRFVFENGLHVPLIIRFPKKFQHLAPAEPGSTNDRLVNFVDFPPTLFSLAGVKNQPSYLQGKAFLGKEKKTPPKYTYGFRGRMDGVYDQSRTVRDKHYRYIRNYMPNRIYGQYVHYLWQAPSMQSWSKAYKRGQLNQKQSKFWQPKPPEELYEIEEDPENIRNLAANPDYKNVLKRMRKANASWIRRIHDAGFMPEAMMVQRASKVKTTIYEYVHSQNYPQKKIISMAEMASLGKPKNLKTLETGFTNPDGAVRYWAAYGCAILKKKALLARQGLIKLLDDPYPDVAIAASEALYHIGEKSKSLHALKKILNSNDSKVRLHALNVVRTFGDGAMPILPALQNMLLHPKPEKGEDYCVRQLKYILIQLTKDEGKSMLNIPLF